MGTSFLSNNPNWTLIFYANIMHFATWHLEISNQLLLISVMNLLCRKTPQLITTARTFTMGGQDVRRRNSEQFKLQKGIRRNLRIDSDRGD